MDDDDKTIDLTPTCPGPMLWFVVPPHPDGAQITRVLMRCSSCSYVNASPNPHDAAHMQTKAFQSPSDRGRTAA